MAYYVRGMRSEDIRQVTEIDREAFPTMFPPTNLHNELRNRLAHYLVVVDTGKMLDQPEIKTATETGFGRLTSRVFRWFNHDHHGEEPQLPGEYIAGFVGMWILVDEAHVTTIAVRESYRGRGLGELLLISIMELAAGLKTCMVTLEVRVSNTVAQKLYSKYGFTKVGLRRAYYTDNQEDGVLMTTPDIQSPAFLEPFRKQKDCHFKKIGVLSYQPAR